MLAFGLSIALVLFWFIVGLAVLALLRPKLYRTQQTLLAPAVGATLVSVIVFVVNRAGVPVRTFGVPLAVGLFALSLIVLVVRRRSVPLNVCDYAPFAGITLLGLVLSGWPMFLYGFDWLSLCNDDMANYVLGGTRFLDHGWFEVPPADVLTNGTDYSQVYWFFHVLAMSRGGCELMVAWTMSLTGISGHQIFMPLILAFHGTLVSAAAALAYRGAEHKTTALLVGLLTAFSALSTFGMLYQLIAQVAGIAILLGLATTLLRPFDDSSWGSLLREGLLNGLMGAGLLVIYPEVVPMIALAWLLYVVVAGVQRKLQWKAMAISIPFAAVAAAVFLQRYFYTSFMYLLYQTKGGTGSAQGEFFPFFKIPSGMVAFWGFKTVFRPMIDPYVSPLIAVSALLLLLMVAAILYSLWRHRAPAGFVAAVMLLLAGFLFYNSAGFGLYKVAMFLQPFMLACVIPVWLAIAPRNPIKRWAPIAIVFLPGAFIQQGYVNYSRGEGDTFIEIPNASQTRVNAEFDRLVRDGAADGRGVIYDSHNVVLAKYQGIYVRDHATSTPGNLFGLQMMGFDPLQTRAGKQFVEHGLRLTHAIDRRIHTRAFDLRPGTRPPGAQPEDPSEHEAVNSRDPLTGLIRPGRLDPRFTDEASGWNRFVVSDVGPYGSSEGRDRALFVGCTGRQSLFNRYHYPHYADDRVGNFFSLPARDVRNHLIFVPSELGRLYGHENQRWVSVYQLEADPNFYLDSTFGGIGQYTLMQLVNPSPKVRLMIEMTTSLKGDGKNNLPNAVLVGNTRERMPFIGRGSARVFSPPIEPQLVANRPLMCLDMQEEGTLLPEVRTGLDRIYGMDVPIDWRQMVGFARDVSLVSDEDYRNLVAPITIAFDIDETEGGRLREPNPLRERTLEYSGVYEDAWCSDTCFFHLTQPRGSQTLVVRGMIPKLDSGPPDLKQEVRVLIDGREVARKAVRYEPFEIRAGVSPADDGPGVRRRRVELRFTANQQFPYPDNRPVAARLHHVGFELPPGAPTKIEKFPQDLSDPAFKSDGLDIDGWLRQQASFELTQLPTHDTLVLRGMVPLIGGNASFATELLVLVDGKEVARAALKLDAFEVRAPIARNVIGRRRIELRFTDTQTLPEPDGREVGALLRYAGFEASAPAAPPR